MRAVKQIKQAEEAGIDIRTLKIEQPVIDSGFIPCKYCGRKFNEISHEKHERICANVVNKPKFDVKKNNRKKFA